MSSSESLSVASSTSSASLRCSSRAVCAAQLCSTWSIEPSVCRMCCSQSTRSGTSAAPPSTAIVSAERRARPPRRAVPSAHIHLARKSTLLHYCIRVFFFCD
eukprot:scaffold40981_cov28-Tisochrysis_lutea.AAC.1